MTGRLEPASSGKPSRLLSATILAGLLEAVRQVLVVEDRHAAAVGLEDLDDLLEELVARILDLALVVDADSRRARR